MGGVVGVGLVNSKFEDLLQKKFSFVVAIRWRRRNIETLLSQNVA